MKRSLTNRATQVLDLLPFAQLLTRRPPSGKLLTAAALVNSPMANRFATAPVRLRQDRGGRTGRRLCHCRRPTTARLQVAPALIRERFG
jgi:hypothetical protein